MAYGVSEIDQQNTTANTYWQLNNEDANHRGAQKFKCGVTGLLDKWIWKLYKVSSPTGTLTAKLYASDGNSPTGAALSTSSTVDPASLTTNTVGAEYTFEFPDDYELQEGTYYWVTIEPSWAPDGTNHVRMIHETATNPYTDGNHNRWNYDTEVWMDDQGTNDDYFKQYVLPLLPVEYMRLETNQPYLRKPEVVAY